MLKEQEAVKLSIYGKFSRAGVVEVKPEELKAESADIVLSAKAAEMLYNDLDKIFGK